MTTIEALLAETVSTCWSHLRNADAAAAADAAGVVRRLGAYVGVLAAEGFGTGRYAAEQQRRAYQISALCAAVAAPGPDGRAADLAGATVDALRVLHVPGTGPERRAVFARVHEAISIAADVLSAATADPVMPRLQSAVLAGGRLADIDPPAATAGLLLDGAIGPSTNRSGPLGPEHVADGLAALTARAQRAVRDRALTVWEARVISAAGLRIAVDVQAVAADLPGVGDAALAAPRAWQAVRARLARLDDGLARTADPAFIAQAVAVARPLSAAIASDFNSGRALLEPAALAASRLPALAACIADRTFEWERGRGLRVFADLAHPSFAQGPYRGRQWDEPAQPSDIAAVRQAAGSAAERAAELAVALERHGVEVPDSHVARANRELTATALGRTGRESGGAGPGAPWARLCARIDPRIVADPHWPALQEQLDLAAAAGADVPALLLGAAQDPVPPEHPARALGYLIASQCPPPPADPQLATRAAGHDGAAVHQPAGGAPVAAARAPRR